MSIVVADQPHFKGQTEDETIFWAYGLYTDKVGDYVKKTMMECKGEEMDEIMKDVINVIPCMIKNPLVVSRFCDLICQL